MSEVVYSSLKPFLFPDHLKAISEDKMVAPVHVRIKPINACNHNCWFCAYRAKDLSLGEQMKLSDQIPKAKMEEIVQDLCEMKVKAVTFSGGGEPLLYAHLIDSMETLSKNKINLGCLSNGSYLKNKMAETWANFGTWIRISMDGWDNASYEKSRGVKPGEFENIINNLKNFKKLKGSCSLGVSFIINEINHTHTYEMCSLLKDIGVTHVKLSGCVVSNSGKINNEYHDKFKLTTFTQIEKSKQLETSEFKVLDHYHGFEENFIKEYQRCNFLNFLTIIGADCMVYTCQDKAYSESGRLGSIKSKRFIDFWFSSENQKSIQNICPKTQCLHHCVSHKKNIILNEFRNLNKEHAQFV